MTELEQAVVMAGEMLTKRAWAEFDAWVAKQSDEVQALSILEQIDLYTMEAKS